MSILLYELRLACRRLIRRPAQAFLTLGTFTVSLALALLSFALYRTIFLTDLGFDPGSRLLVVRQIAADTGANPGLSTPAELAQWSTHQTQFASFAAGSLDRTVMLTDGGTTERLFGSTLSSGLLRLLDAQPLLGRLFNADDDRPGSTSILLSHRLWQTRFGSDPAIVGSALRVESRLATVVGVMPSDFRFPNDQQLWLCTGFAPQWATDYANSPFLDIIGRLKPGATLDNATAELTRIATETRAAGSARAGLRPHIIPLRHFFIPDTLRLSATVLFALAVLFVFGGCLNTANLVLIDFLGRANELGVAASLGLTRSALIRQVVLQITVLTIVAALLALHLVSFAGPVLFDLLAQTTAPTPYWLQFTPDRTLFVAGLAVGLGAALIASLGPAVVLLATSPEQLMRNGASGLRGTGRSAWRHTLVTVQVALLTILAVFAGLMLHSSWQLGRRATGFDADNVLNIRIALNAEDYKTPEARVQAAENALAKMRALPGVTSAAVIHEDLDYYDTPNGFLATQPDGLANGAYQDQAKMTFLSDEFFSVACLRFVEGKNFERGADASGPDYAILTQSLAARLWPGQSALGRSLWIRRGFAITAPSFQVIVRGVITDFQAGAGLAQQRDAVFTHLSHQSLLYYNLLVRGAHGVPALPVVTRAMRHAAPNIALYFPRPWKDKLSRPLQIVTLTTRLTSIYAVVAGLLCLIGVYSLTVAAFAQRTREFGIRLALGGVPSALWRHFARSYLACAGVGVGAGLAVAAGLTHFLNSLLYGVSRWDAATFVLVAIGILVLTALACLPSLQRFRRLDPAICLRNL